jgi:uncharacterized delta-60 repeat protein
MKKLLVLILFFNALSTYTQFKEWERSYNGSGNGNDQASFIAADQQGNVLVCGRTASTGNNNDFCTIKYSPAGAQIWTAIYNGPANDVDLPSGMTVDNSGNVYVTGITRASGNYNIATIKYNSSGIQQWAQTWNGVNNFDEESGGIYVDNSGNVYVTGTTEVTSGVNYNYITLKYDPAGVLQWAKQYNNPLNSIDNGIFIAGTGNDIYVTGSSYAAGTNWDLLTIKYNPNGDSLWTVRYSGTANTKEIPYGFAVDLNGNAYVTGMTEDTSSGIDYLTVKYNSNGIEQWHTRFTSPGNSQDIPEGLAIDGSGNVYVTGRTRFNSSYNDFGTVKYNSSGQQQWAAIYDNTSAGRDDYGYDIAADNSGNVYVTGNSQQSGNDRDILTIKYNSTGNEQWVARYDSATSEEAFEIILDAANNVYVCGYQTLGSPDFVTIKYSQLNGVTPISNEIQAGYQLTQNYPNPFNPVTNINISLPKTGFANLSVFDSEGKEAAVLVNGVMAAGNYKVDFDASGFASGIYFYTLNAGGYTLTKKMILLK